MLWNKGAIAGYQPFAKDYVSNFNEKIDCADLAFAALIDYAVDNGLPLRFRYFARGECEWYAMPADATKAVGAKFKAYVLRMLGALNIIDNTRKFPLDSAEPGDLIMTRWSSTLGHTRIITEITFDPTSDDYRVVWYQGNLPPVKPVRKSGLFSTIDNVYEGAPRRWKFSQFNA
jgi:hypothetical protein